MRSRWNDAEARTLDGLDLLVYASRLIGAETSLVVWGGGNTSVKTVERDHRGRELSVLRVKGSGSDLKSVQRKDFPGVRMDDIRALLDRQDMGDQEMVAYLAHGLMDPGGVRPSIETLLHGFVDAPAVVHTHADAIVSLTNNDRPREVLASVYGKDVIALSPLDRGVAPAPHHERGLGADQPGRVDEEVELGERAGLGVVPSGPHTRHDTTPCRSIEW
jgi:rhamnose utilization protein RhaD (predicted bifunctional aldolase and dehydrogenase)